jgi:hypothetical protein
MSKRASECASCKHWREGEGRKPRHGVFCVDRRGWWFACLRGHKPRFFYCASDPWNQGWKRNCSDFEAVHAAVLVRRWRAGGRKG